MRRLRFRWAGRMAILLLAGVCIAEDLLQQEVISREVGLFVGQSPQPPPPVLERVAVTNGGFESVPIVQNLLYWTNRAGWTGSGNPSFGGPLTYGRGNNGGLPAPSEGEQAVGLQKDAVIFTPLTVPHPGAYFLSWRHASRAGQVNPYIVFTNRVSGTSGTAVGPRVPVSPVFNTSSTEWSTVTLPMWFNQAGTVLLGFAGLNSGGGDETVVLDDVQLMRYVSEGTRTLPEMREVVSREASFYIEGNRGGLLEEVVSREVSFTVDAVGTPPPVLDLAMTVSPTGETVTVDWSGFYNPWAVKDVAAFHVYQSATPFDSVAGRTPTRVVPADTLSTTFTGLPAWRDSYYAVVAVDALGNAGTEVVCSGAYVLMPELVSREASFFVGNGPDREVISRETSLLIDNPGSPVAVGRFLVMPSANGDSVTLDWSSYNSWQEKDVVHYRVYYSDRLISSLEGVPWVQVPGETFRWTFNGLTPWTDHFFAVIPVDGLGNSAPGFHYQGAYVLMPEVVSREAGVFVGDEPVPPYREVISREASLVVADAVVPAPVTGITSGFLAGTSRSRYGAIDLDWTAYAEEEQRDIVRYRLYSSDRFFTNVTEMAWTAFPENPDRWDGRRRATIQGLDPAQIHYVAVVAEDAAGKFNPNVYSVSAKASIGSLGDVRNLAATPKGGGWELRWDVGAVGDNVEDFLKEIRFYPGRNVAPMSLGPLVRSQVLSPLRAVGGTTVKVTTVDVFSSESPGVTLEFSAPQPFVGTDASLMELTGYVQDLLLRDGTFPVSGLTVALVSGPTGLVVTNGVLAWTPTEAQGPSTNLVTVTVTDGSLTTTNSLTLTVLEVNEAPQLSVKMSSWPEGLELVAWWDFERIQSNGITLRSVVGDYPATIHGQAKLSADGGGRPGGGRGFDISLKNPGYFVHESVGQANPLNVAAVDDEITITVWQKTYSKVNSSTFWALAGDTPRSTQAHIPWSDNNLYWDTAGCCDSGQRLAQPVGNLDFNSWHLYSFVKRGAVKEVWYDGNLIQSRGGFNRHSVLNYKLLVGSDNLDGRFSPPDAVLDDFAIWRGALTEDQIRRLAAGATPAQLAGGVNPPFVGASGVIDEHIAYSEKLVVVDRDLPEQAVSVNLLSGPSGLTVADGTLKWTPSEEQGPSTNRILVVVSDGIESVTNEFNVTVREVNAPPTLAGATDVTIDELVAYTQNLSPADVDIPAQSLTVALVSGPTGLVVTNGVLAWTPTEAQGPSTNVVTVTVTDGTLTTTNSLTLTVREVNLPPSFAGTTNATINELVAYTQNLSPVDVDIPAQSLTVALVSGPTGLVVTNGVLTWTPTEAQGPSTNLVTVTVNDGSLTTTNSLTLTVREVNAPPSFAGATNATINELVAYTQNLAPVDVDLPAQPLTVALVSGPTGLVVTNGVLVWTPTEAQGPSTNLVTVTVTDGSLTTTNSLTLTVREVNVAPSFAGATNATINEVVAYTQNLAPADVDLPAQPLTVALVSGPTGLVVTNSVLAWTPTEAQGPSTNVVTVTVTDGSLTTTNSLTLTVREMNLPPSFAGATNATINEVVAYTQNLAPADVDLPAQPLTVALVSGPTGLVVTNGVLAWTPTEAQGPSTNVVTVTVTDGSLTTTNSLTLTVREVNVAPSFAGTTNATINELVAYTQNLAPADVDLPAQSLTVALVSGPTGLVVTNGVLFWTPTEAQGPSTNGVTVTVTDGSLTTTNSLTLTVREVNLPPSFAGTTNATISELVGHVQNLAPQDADIPAQSLTVALVSGPTGLVVTNGVLAWTPTEAQGPSTNLVTITVTDGSLTTTNSLTLTVREVNAPPSFAGTTNATINELVAYTQNLAPVDVDLPAQPLTVALASGPTGLVVTNGVLAWTPTEAQGPSTNVVTVTVTDGTLTTTNSLTLTVREVNLPPSFAGTTNATINELVGYTHNLAPADVDIPAQSLTVALASGPTGLVVTNGVLAWTPTEAQGPSTNLVTVTVTDGSLATTNSLTLTVREVNLPPSFVGATNATINELVAYTQNLAPADVDIPAQSLTVALVSGPTGLVVTNGVLAWKPTEAQGPSTNVVTVTVTDGSLTTTNSLTLTVREVNAPPSFAGATNATINELVAYTQNLAPVDVDIPAQPLTVALVSGPTGLVVTNGVLNWTPAAGLGGSTNPVVVRVSDGVASVTNAFVLTVRSTLPPARLSGLIDYFASAGGPVRGVVLAMGGSGSGAITTGADGGYSMEMPGGAFTVTPTLETDTPAANGVTTADIAVLRRHILGITSLDSAHKVLAGDVNGSSSVTTADITLIRRLILGISTNFTGGLWRFVPSDEVFTNAMSPWTSRRGRSYATMPTVATGHDFKAIKLGDVNGSWKAPTTSGASTIQAKSKPKAQLVVGSGRDLGDGVTVHSVTLRGVRSLTSLQFTLAWDPAEAAYVGIEAGALKDLGSENLGAARAGQGLVSVSWDPANGVARDLGGEAIVLGLKLRTQPGRTLSRLTVPERPTALEVTEATVPVSVGVVGWSAGTDGLSALGGVGDSGGPTSAAAGSLAAAARLRVLGPDAAGQVILEVTAAEDQTVQVQWSMDLKSWTPVWQGSGEGPDSPIRLEPQGLSPSDSRFWRVTPTGR